mgnify:FL=1
MLFREILSMLFEENLSTLFGENLHAILGHEEGVLPLCRWLFVARDNLPSIGVVGVYEDLPCSHIDHRLDGKHHSWYQEHACATMAVVEYLGLLVHLQSYTMAAEVAHYAIAMLFGMLLDGVADVSGKAVGFGCCCANLQALFGHADQLLLFRCGLAADDEHA